MALHVFQFTYTLDNTYIVWKAVIVSVVMLCVNDRMKTMKIPSTWK